MSMQVAEPTGTTGAEPLLSRFTVVGLFGRYTYSVDLPEGKDGRLLLLHGDNGSGKTTILRLLWNLLSQSEERGHRTAVARSPFKALTVDFTDGSRVVAAKHDELVGPYDVTVSTKSGDEFAARYEVDEHMVVRRASIRPRDAATPMLIFDDEGAELLPGLGQVRSRMADESGRRQYHDFLTEHRINPLLLADDRSLYADDEELDRIRERFVDRDLADRRRSISPRSSGDTVARELQITFRRVNDRLRTLALGGQNVGSAGANSIYRNVLVHLGGASQESTPLTPHSVDSPEKLLRDLAESSPRFEEFELVPHFAADEFMTLLDRIDDPERKKLAHEILAPYLDSLRARQSALAGAEQLLRSLTSLINEFLTDKQVVFTPREGLRIFTEDGIPLQPESLSSGERQLTMLLCTTVLAGRDSKLFLIDEPELSLGVSWQRKILDALLTLTAGAGLQFVVATHSIEIMSGQPESLVKLVRQRHGR